MNSTIRAVVGGMAALLAAVAAGSSSGAHPATSKAPGTTSPAASPGSRVQSHGSIDLAALAAGPRAPLAASVPYAIQREVDRTSTLAGMLRPRLVLGGGNAPASSVSNGGGGGTGINGVNILEMEKAGTGSYAGTNGGLEPPDQALCVGNGYVLEGVNTAWKVFRTTGAAITPAVPLTQFFKIAPGGQAGPSSFVSDPRCLYDSRSGRFFALMLEADEASGVTQIPFIRSHTYFAVSKTGDPSGDWWIYSIDITDDGLMGTPAHPTCPCIDDQPLMGLDQYGLYLSANEFSDTEIFPVPPPSQVFTAIGSLPDFRNGQAQVYAISKAALLNGTLPAVTAFDTATIPVPAQDQGKTPISIWSSLQPAASPPGDHSPVPAGGAEFFLSSLDFQGTGDNRVAVWAMTNTSSLATSNPSLTLKNTVITTLDPTAQTYTSPAIGVDQKDGPHPLGDQCSCPEEQIAANDDRMNQVMLTNGTLWAGVNTELAPANPSGTGKDADPRAGIMYFQVRPGVDAGGNVTATMVRDGYVQVAGNNVVFPSIAASPAGPTAMFFSLSGVDYFPSAAWAELDGLAQGQAPVIHVSGPGTAPEDGFTGYPTTNQLGVPFDPSSGPGVSRWGDYSAAGVDENGCLWGADEYIPDEARDVNAGNWGTFITRVQPQGCSEPALTTTTTGPKLNINPCGPAFTGQPGNDQLILPLAGPVPGTQGQNPQLDILAGNISLSPDGTALRTSLTIQDLNTNMPTGGEGNNYYFYWQFGGVQYYTLAAVDSTGAVTYGDGTVTTAGRSPRGAADTGTFTPGPNGTITVDVPLSAVGRPHAGNLLQGPIAETREVEGQALVVQYDTAGPTFDVLLGAVCSRTASAAGPHGGTAGATSGPLSIPNTSAPGPAGTSLVLAGLAFGGGAAVARAGRRRRRRSAARV